MSSDAVTHDTATTAKIHVHIHGQTLQTFQVTIADAHGEETFDIHALLQYEPSDAGSRLAESVVQEHFWSQISAWADEQTELFERGWYETYMAHCDRFARYMLQAQKERAPSATARERIARIIFSAQITEKERLEYARMAYSAYVDETQRVGTSAMSFDEFQQLMYGYEQSIEDVERIRQSYIFQARRLKIVSDAFKNLVWSLRATLTSQRAFTV